MSKEVGDKIGDYEIVEVYHKPIYKMRKRITINNKVCQEEYRGKKGWMYVHDSFYWVELDGYPKKQLKFKDIELTY